LLFAAAPQIAPQEEEKKGQQGNPTKRRKEEKEPENIHIAAEEITLENESIYENVKDKLSLNIPPNAFVCRENELKKVRDFIRDPIAKSFASVPLLISGTPGTGKTATVLQAVSMLQKEKAEGTIPEFDFMHINSLSLENIFSIYTLLYRRISGSHRYPLIAMSELDKLFNQCNYLTPPIYRVVLIDEVDRLITEKQGLLYKLFTWAGLEHSKLLLILITTNYNFPQKLLPKIKSRLGNKYIHFSEYNKSEIETIINERVSKFNIFDEDAIRYLANRISINSGDIRKCFNILKSALDSAEKLYMDIKRIVKVSKELLIKSNTDLLKSNMLFNCISNFTDNEIILIAALSVERADTAPVSFERLHKRICGMNHSYGVKLLQKVDITLLLYNLERFGLIQFEAREKNIDYNRVLFTMKVAGDSILEIMDATPKFKLLADIVSESAADPFSYRMKKKSNIVE